MSKSGMESSKQKDIERRRLQNRLAQRRFRRKCNPTTPPSSTHANEAGSDRSPPSPAFQSATTSRK